MQVKQSDLEIKLYKQENRNMSFYTALTGLNGSQADIAATSNNIANVATTGYKGQELNLVIYLLLLLYKTHLHLLVLVLS